MEQLIAIVAAMNEEIKPLVNKLEDFTIHRRHGFSFLQGYIAEKKVILAKSGIGRNNARAMMKILVNNFPVSLIISTGYAGALQPFLKAGDLVVADKLFLIKSQPENIPISKKAIKKAILVYKVKKDLLKPILKVLQTSQLRYYVGPFITMDEVLGRPDIKRLIGEHLKCLAVEMETAAIAEIVKEKGIPFLALRSITDSLGDNIDIALALYKDIKNNTSLIKRLSLLLRHPRGSIELARLIKNCTKVSNIIANSILQLLSNSLIFEQYK